ncbi:MAG: mannitol dehydrogenase, partial [Clostridia bacterium]
IQTPEMNGGDILRVCVEKFCTLIVDRAAFKGEIPKITNMSAFSPFELYIERKLYIHNMGHSMTAYLGALKGYEYIWQAIADPEIELFVVRGMVSSAMALSMKYNVPFKDLYEHVEDLLYRFTNKKLGDTVFRVGRDLKRKLSPDDRLLGAIKTCRSVGVSPTYLHVAVAAAMKFSADDVSQISPSEILTTIAGLSSESEDYKAIMEFVDILNGEDGLKCAYNRAKRIMSV